MTSLSARERTDLIVDATSVSGSLVSDFGIRWDASPDGAQCPRRSVTGGARLWVKTVSGDLRLLRGRAVA